MAAKRPKKSRPIKKADPTEKRTRHSALQIQRYPGETNETALARTTAQPEIQAAYTQLVFNNSWLKERPGMNELVSELARQTQAVKQKKLGRGEEMLAAQAHTLDTLFNYLSRKATRSEYLSQFEAYLKLALRSQAQCRSTWEAISAMQNPPLAGYVNQANIAHGHQQVNNASRAEENKTAPSKLLEKSEHEPDTWMDRGTPTTAEGVDSAVEAVGEVHGPTDGGGKE